MVAKRQPPLRTILEVLSFDTQKDAGGPAAKAAPEVDWPAVFSCAGHCLVTPALLPALTASGRIDALHPDERDYLTELALLNRDRRHFLQQQLARLAAKLNECGVTPVLLKGAIALLPEQYPGAEDRILTDFDVLIPAESMEAARQAVVSLGYEEECSYAPWLTEREQEDRHQITSFIHPSMPLAVELHRRFVTDRHDSALLAEHMSLDAVQLPNGASVLLPDPATRLLHNMLHAQLHHRGAFSRELDVRQLYEFALLARHYGARLSAPDLLRRLRPCRRHLLSEYWAMAERWLGLAYPEDLPRSPRERRELLAIGWVSFHPAAKRAMRLIGSSLLLPGRLVIALRRSVRNPAFLPNRLRRLRPRRGKPGAGQRS